MDVRIVGIGTANPPLRLSQEEIYQAYVETLPLSDTAQSLLKRFFVDNQSIGFRHLGMDQLTDALQNSQDQLIARYQKFAVPVAVEAARRALARAECQPDDVDALVVNTCTGYLCPGLSSYIAELLPLRKNVRPFDLQGMGCGGAIPSLETGYNYLQAHPESVVLTLSVEICSATLFFSEAPDVLVSNAIFGDGGAATVLTNHPGHQGVRLLRFAAGLFPEHRPYLQYITQDSKLRNVLSQRVPVLGGRNGKRVIDDLLSQNGTAYADITHWIVHPGGEKVLDAFQRSLNLPAEALQPSRQVLYNYGNMSSASVLFVLDEVMQRGEPQAGEVGLLCSFGAGFSAFAALVEFLQPMGAHQGDS
jgi:predicted naringenin-chalcone synthase